MSEFSRRADDSSGLIVGTLKLVVLCTLFLIVVLPVVWLLE